MACTDVERKHAVEGEMRSRDLTNCELRERPPHNLIDLLKALNREISSLQLYNFQVTNKTTNPPLPQMTLFDPNAISVSVNLPNTIHPSSVPPQVQSGAEHFMQYVLQNLRNTQSTGNTKPFDELKQISKGGHISFLGPAGSGKTTLLRIIARNSVNGKNGYPKVKRVHIIHPGPFEGETSKSECLARNVIFSCNIANPKDKFTDDESKRLFNYALKCPNDFLLIFDSLDTLPQELSEVEDPGKEYSHDRKYPPLVHLKMLLQGRLLKGCRIVTSSRPHAIRKFEGDLRPTRIISLLGFSKPDALAVLKLYSNDADEIFKIVNNNSHLFSLFKEPVFLVYLVKIWPDLSEDLDKMRATDVLLKVVSCFYQSEHAKGNYDKLKDMQRLAREILWRKKFEFNETSLKEYGLKIEDLTDMCTNASDENGKHLILKLTTGVSLFLFSHQSMQEMFAALDVAESNLQSFRNKISIIHGPFFRKTRDFVYGLVFGRFGHDDSEFPDIEMKCHELKQSIELQFRRAFPPEQLSIFETLAEAITDVGQFKLVTDYGVNLSGIPMNDWSLYCTGIASSQFTILQVLHLEGCALQLSHLRALEAGIDRFNRQYPQILSFSLRGNANIKGQKEAVNIACKIVRKCKVGEFNMGACGLNEEGMTEMLEGLRHTTVAVLGLEHNRIGKKGMQIAGTIVKQCSVKEINLTGCASAFSEVEAFGISAKGSDIHRLIAEDKDGRIVCAYGKVIRHCNLRTLTIVLSALNPDQAMRMREYSSDGKIFELQFTALITKMSPPPRAVAIPATKSNCESIRNLFPIVKNEISIPIPIEDILTEKLQFFLDDLKEGSPVIKIPGTMKIFTLMSKKRQGLTDDKSRHVTDPVGQEKEVDIVDGEEIAMEMESEYLNVSNGSDTMTWLNKYKMHPNLVTDVLANYGLSIHRYNMTDQDIQLVTEILSHCSELKSFSFSHSTGLKPMLDVLVKESRGASLPEVTNVCFAGYKGISKELSHQFVQYVKLLRAEGLVLTSVNVSHECLKALKGDLKKVKQEGHFKRLEIFHNPDIGDGGWACLAQIAKECSDAPLHLSTCYCDVKDSRLKSFKNALQDTKLGKIDICGNRKLTVNGFKTLGEIVKGNEVPSVTLQDCNLDVEKVRAFNNACGIESASLVIVSLNVANNPNLGSEGFEEIKKTVQQFHVENLNIASCRLDDVDFEHEFESLDISGNPKCGSIPKLAKSTTQRLYLRNCMLNASELKELAMQIKQDDRKLEEIDVSDASRQINCEIVDFLVELFKEVTEYITVADTVTIPTTEE